MSFFKKFFFGFIMGWLAVLSLGLFVYALGIKMHGFIEANVNVILITSALLVLVFFSVGKISLGRIENKTKMIIPK